MPDLSELDHFDEGLPVMNPLPAAEIRRRGDRLRRRRTALLATGGVLAVALAIGAPVLAFSGSDPDRHDNIQPAPSPGPTHGSPTQPPHGWLTEVLDFPIQSKFPTPLTKKLDANLLPDCDGYTPFAGSPYVQDTVVSYRGESENQAQRWLLLYADQQAAEDAMAQAHQGIRDCPADGGVMSPGGSLVYREVPVDLGTEDSFAWTEQVDHGDGLLSDLTYVQAARTGNAVYVESSYGSPGGDEVIGQVQRLLTQRSRDPLSVLCVYAVDQCMDPYAPATATPVGPEPSSETLSVDSSP